MTKNYGAGNRSSIPMILLATALASCSSAGGGSKGFTGLTNAATATGHGAANAIGTTSAPSTASSPADSPSSSGSTEPIGANSSAQTASTTATSTEAGSGPGTTTATGTAAAAGTVTPIANRPVPQIVQQCTPPPQGTAAGVNLALDVPYSAGPMQQLDIAWPKTGTSHPLIVVVHGGGFTGGDKTAQRAAIIMLATNGYAAASLNYRLATNAATQFPAPIQDVRCAVRWLRANAATYTIDPTHVGAEGDSAGATLVSLLGTATQDPAFDSPDCKITPAEQSSTVLAVVSNAGRADLHLDPATNPAVAVSSIQALLGLTNATDATATALKAIVDASAITYVTPTSAAFLLLHGTLDPRVLPIQDTLFLAALTKANVPAAKIEGQGWGHAPPIFSGNPLYEVGLCSAMALFKQYLQP